EQKLDAGGIGEPRSLAVLRPAGVPTHRRRGRDRTGAVHAEQAELEPVAVLHPGAARRFGVGLRDHARTLQAPPMTAKRFFGKLRCRNDKPRAMPWTSGKFATSPRSPCREASRARPRG